MRRLARSLAPHTVYCPCDKSMRDHICNISLCLPSFLPCAYALEAWENGSARILRKKWNRLDGNENAFVFQELKFSECLIFHFSLSRAGNMNTGIFFELYSELCAENWKLIRTTSWKAFCHCEPCFCPGLQFLPPSLPRP